MTVAEFIELLEELPHDKLVVFSSDAEGNWFRPASNALSIGHTYKDGEIIPSGGAPCVVFYPED